MDNLSSHPTAASVDQNLTQLFAQAPAPIAIYKGRELVYSFVNEAYARIFNYRDILGKPLREAFPELEGQSYFEILENVFATGIPFSASATPAQINLHGDGTLHTRYYNLVYTPYKNESGEIEGVMAFGHDVTDQVAANQKVYESEERLRMALDSAQMGTWETLPESDTLYFSERCKALFGFPPEGTITKAEADAIIIESDRERVAAAIGQALRPGSDGTYAIEYSIFHKPSGEIRTIRASGQAFFEGGVARRFIGTAIDITEEVKHRAEQRKLLTLIDNSIELMSVLELEGKNSYINKAGMQMLGFDTFQQVLDTPIADLHTPEDAAFVQANVLPAVMTAGRWSGTMNVRHIKTGEVFPVYNNTIRIDDPATGEPLAVGAVMRDMRPELAVQRALAESEANFRNMILQAPVAMCILLGPEHRVEIANGRMYEIWGKSPDALLGKPMFEELPEAAGQGFEAHLQQVFSTGESFAAYEQPISLPRNGTLETVYLNFVYDAFRDGDGSIKGIIAASVDVTAQVIARQKIAFAEERARLAIESAELGAYEVNLQTNEMHTSDRFKAIWGQDFDKNRSGYASVLHPEDLPLRNKAHADSIASGYVSYEARIFWPDNSLHWVKVKGRVFYNETGVPTKLLGVVQDITEQKLFSQELEKQVQDRTKELQEANQRLQQTNAELEQFAYVSSHDLQEPLRKIRMFAEMIREKDGANFSEYSLSRFSKITEAAQRMSTSLADLLNFSSLSKEEQFMPVNMNDVLQSVMTDLELAIAQKGALIHKAALPTLSAIPLQMHQLLYNLLNNALKFSGKDTQPVITISCRRLPATEAAAYPKLKADKSYYELVVKDNGIGFQSEMDEKIFLLFQRLHDRQTYSGTGIGLALCKKVADNHGGHIFAVSSPGAGAAFHILLPTDH